MWRISSRSFAIIFLLLGTTSVCAQRDRDTYNPGNQSFEVSGQVNIAGTNNTVRDVPVRLERFSGGVIDQITTDARGRFRFGNLQRGYYKVISTRRGSLPPNKMPISRCSSKPIWSSIWPALRQRTRPDLALRSM